MIGKIAMECKSKKYSIILFHLEEPPSLKVVMVKWFYYKRMYVLQ